VPSRVSYASGRHIDGFISFLSTILAALLLIGAIIVLYKVKSPDVKLGLIGVFTVLFAASVGLLTNARRAEVFAATAA
jgi:predicted anti-sigma-YlaC factor YlaD